MEGFLAGESGVALRLPPQSKTRWCENDAGQRQTTGLASCPKPKLDSAACAENHGGQILWKTKWRETL
jgi:hypothetical protein